MRAVATANHDLAELPAGGSRLLSFPPFRLDLTEERLWKDDAEVRLRRKPFAILRYLAQHPRQLVTHSEIVRAVWGGEIAMSESLLRTHISDLRSVLGDDVIETVVGRGYRFAATVSNVEEAGSPRRPTSGREARPLRLVRCQPPAETPTPSADHARILKELAGMLAALGPNATVLLIVAGATSPDGGGVSDPDL
jgi:DNA-binding winged helix-turn-helix (wHTH) protein